MSQPSVIISQDLSGIGQVSMGVALPLLAALDFAPYCLPTAVLSTHTGFKASVGVSLAPQMQKRFCIGKAWRSSLQGYC